MRYYRQPRRATFKRVVTNILVKALMSNKGNRNIEQKKKIQTPEEYGSDMSIGNGCLVSLILFVILGYIWHYSDLMEEYAGLGVIIPFTAFFVTRYLTKRYYVKHGYKKYMDSLNAGPKIPPTHAQIEKAKKREQWIIIGIIIVFCIGITLWVMNEIVNPHPVDTTSSF